MARVLIIGPNEQSGHDYSPARQHGELVKVFAGKFNPFRTDQLIKALQTELIDQLQVTTDDVLLLCGNPVLNAIVVALFQERFEQFTILIYGAKQNDYTARTIDLAKDLSETRPAHVKAASHGHDAGFYLEEVDEDQPVHTHG